MSVLYLIRHPQTRVDLSAPAHTWHLSDEGHAQVEALAEARFWARVAAIYPSEERKAVLPAEIIAARYGLPVRPLPMFNEVNRGAYTAPDRAAYQAAVEAFFSRPEESVHGWETASSALTRFRSGVEMALAGPEEGESLAGIGHGLALTLYMAHLRGEEPSAALMAPWRALGFGAVAAVERATLRPLTDFVAALYVGLPEV